ncbi:MAG: TolC family protein [Bacteroidales bacterium]|nr:TolC family protein [Bacteroidales bacterium]
MLKSALKGLLSAALALFFIGTASAQTREGWTLQQCIDYALQNNIQIKTQEITLENAEASLEQAKAQQYPTLSFSSSFGANFQNVTTYNEYMEKAGGVSVSNNFGLNSGMALYQGGRLRNTVKQSQVQRDATELDVEQARIDLEISVAQAFLQVLYNHEALELKRQAEELSARQVERGEQLFSAGSISRVELSQLKSQYASDQYQTVAAENTLESSRLQLKQLLELGLDQPFEIAYPVIDDSVVGAPIPELADVYAEALATLPQMKSSQLDIESADLGVQIAKGSALPSISMNAGISTGYSSAAGTRYFDQLGNKLGESLGLNLSLPIFNGKQVRTNVKKAQLQLASARLQDASARKQLLSTLESVRNDAVSAQQRYFASKAQLEAAGESFRLVTEQFNAGIKNTVELLTEKNNYLSALSQQLQAKYQALLAEKLLDRYMNQPIEL